MSRLYLPRREGGRGLLSVEDAISTEERNTDVYSMLKKSPSLSVSARNVSWRFHGTETLMRLNHQWYVKTGKSKRK